MVLLLLPFIHYSPLGCLLQIHVMSSKLLTTWTHFNLINIYGSWYWNFMILDVVLISFAFLFFFFSSFFVLSNPLPTSLASLDFINVPPTHSLESMHKMVTENGGTFSMNLNQSVTHCVAAESKGLPISLSCIYTQSHTRGQTHLLSVEEYDWRKSLCQGLNIRQQSVMEILFIALGY